MYGEIVLKEVVPIGLERSDDPCSESDSSEFTDGFNLWPAAMCFGCFVYRPTAILESTGRLPTTFTAVMSRQFFGKVILPCSVGSLSCFITGSIHRHFHSHP